MKRGITLLLKQLLHLSSDCFVCSGCLGKAIEEVTEVKSRTTRDEWYVAFAFNLPDRLIGAGNEITDGELLPGVKDIDVLVGDFLKQLFRRLSRPYVKVSVHLHGVGIYYLITV